MTKIETMNAIVEALNTTTVENKIELIDFMYAQIDQAEKRATKEKERAAAKRAEGDALREQIFNALDTEEFMFTEDILAKVDFEGATKPKIVARLTALAKLGMIEKEQRKTDAGVKRMAYRKIAE